MQFLLHFFLIFGLFLFFGENAQSAGEHMQYAQGKAHEKKQMGWPKTQARVRGDTRSIQLAASG
jgi:hypothetical protein